LDQYKPARAFYDYSYSLVQHSDSSVLLDMFLSLHIPKLFVYGSENSKLSYIPTLKKKCETAEISKSHHFPQHDNPTEFYNRISEFISNL
jgi:pimeloyl-ACP methyl ester carboxylesterase